MAAETKSVARAALWMSVSLVSFSMMAVAGRELGEVLGTAELLIWRSIIGFVILTVIIAFTKGGFGKIRTQRLPLHVMRNIFHFAGQYCWFFALTLIPLAQLFAFEFTSPIWLAMFAAFFLGERFTIWKAIAIACGFVGILLVAQPGSGTFGAGQIWALASAIGFASQMICTKKLTETDSVLTILFLMTVLQTPIGMLAWGGLPSLPGDAYTAFWLLALAVGSLCAHYSLTRAFTYADATVVVPMDFFRLPLITLIGVLVYSEPFDLLIIAGGALIFFGNFINIWGSRPARKPLKDVAQQA